MKRQIIFTICLLVATMFHSCKNKDFSDEEYIAFAKNIEQSIVEGNAHVLNEAFDYHGFESLIFENLALNNSQKQEANRFIETELLPGQIKVDFVQNGGDFYFLKFYRKNNQARLLFRLYYQGGISIEEYLLKVVDGQIKIEDIFMVNSGVKWSEDFRLQIENRFGIINEEVANTNKLIVAKNYLENDEIEQADSLLYFLLPQAQNNLYARVLELKLSSYQLDYEEMEMIADDFCKDFPHEQRIAYFYLIHSALSNGLVEETQKNIALLADSCGFDPIYYLYLSQVFFNVEAYDFALQTLDSAIAYIPGLFDLYVEKMNIYYAIDNYEKLTETMFLTDKIFLPMPEDVKNYSKHFSKAVNSSYFQEWIKQRKNMQYNGY